MSAPNRVVILGSGGFIGKALVALLEKEQIPYLGISSKETDLAEPKSVEMLSALLEPNDAIVMAAALTPRYGKGIDVFVKNMLIAQHVSLALQNCPPSHAIYLSSDAVYPFGEGLTTERSIASPQDLYGAMHHAREICFKSALGCPLLICRPTLIYGFDDPHNSYGPNRMRRSAQKLKKITLFGRGEEIRDHIYIDDVASLLLSALLQKCEGVINLATGRSISYWDLAHKVAALFDDEIAIETSPRANGVTYRHYDILALHQLFPLFRPTPLEEGLTICHSLEFPSLTVL